MSIRFAQAGRTQGQRSTLDPQATGLAQPIFGPPRCAQDRMRLGSRGGRGKAAVNLTEPDTHELCYWSCNPKPIMVLHRNDRREAAPCGSLESEDSHRTRTGPALRASPAAQRCPTRRRDAEGPVERAKDRRRACHRWSHRELVECLARPSLSRAKWAAVCDGKRQELVVAFEGETAGQAALDLMGALGAAEAEASRAVVSELCSGVELVRRFGLMRDAANAAGPQGRQMRSRHSSAQAQSASRTPT